MTTPAAEVPHGSPAGHERPSRDGATDTLAAIANALKLGSSLVATLAIAIAMKFVMPRYLGPTSFGTLSFADGFTGTFFVALNLGADAYVRKEVSVRPAHASDFLGGALVLRAAMSVAIFGIMALVMRATGRSPEVRTLVYLFGAAQFFVSVNATLSALLHASGRVGGMSALAVATKIVWAAGVVAAIAMGTGLWGFAAAYLASESIESLVLFGLASRHLGLVFRVDAAATKAMIVSSLPYFLNVCATGVYGKLDVTLLGIFGAGQEVGWYVAASSMAALTLIVTPLIEWVLTPVFARGAVRSREDLYGHVRQATEPILAVAIPAALFVGVGADLWIRLLFGHAFAPAAMALRVLSASSVVVYIAIVYALDPHDARARVDAHADLDRGSRRERRPQHAAHPSLDDLLRRGGGRTGLRGRGARDPRVRRRGDDRGGRPTGLRSEHRPDDREESGRLRAGRGRRPAHGEPGVGADGRGRRGVPDGGGGDRRAAHEGGVAAGGRGRPRAALRPGVRGAGPPRRRG